MKLFIFVFSRGFGLFPALHTGALKMFSFPHFRKNTGLGATPLESLECTVQ
jgi:hypothetical protein